jgi:hypothetical protein
MKFVISSEHWNKQQITSIFFLINDHAEKNNKKVIFIKS